MFAEKKRVSSSLFITLAAPKRDPGPGKDPPTKPLAGGTALPPPPPPPPLALHLDPAAAETPEPNLQATWAVPAGRGQPQPLRSAEEPLAEEKPRKEAASSGEVCAFCHKALSRQAPALRAMDKHYHSGCFACRSCHTALAGQPFFWTEGRPLCGPCYQDTLERCAACGAPILERVVRALGSAFHPECFSCVACGRPIGDGAFALDDANQVHCLQDFYRTFATPCGSCGKPIVPGKDAFRIECMGRHFHEDCFRCQECGTLLSPEPTEQGCHPLGQRLLCKPCCLRSGKAASS